MTEFFTNHISQGPDLSSVEQMGFILLLLCFLFLSLKFYQKRWFRGWFYILLAIQVVSLYTWHIVQSIPLLKVFPFIIVVWLFWFFCLENRGQSSVILLIWGCLAQYWHFYIQSLTPTLFPILLFSLMWLDIMLWLSMPWYICWVSSPLINFL